MRILLFIVLASLLFAQTGCGTQRSKPPTKNQRAADINVSLAANYLALGDLEQANIKLERALRQDPKSASVHSNYALLQEALGYSDLARKHYRKAISLDKVDPNIRNNYAAFLFKRGAYEKALQEFMLAAENPLYQTPEYAYTNAGRCALKLGDMESAEDYFRAALIMNPKFSDALFLMAKIKLEQQEYLLTRAFLQRLKEVAEIDSHSLWIGYQAERKLGNFNASGSYALQLKNNYPKSKETVLLLKSQRNEPRIRKRN